MASIPNVNKTRISVVTKPTNVSVVSAGIRGAAGETQDLSNYAVLNGGNNFTGVQNIIGAVTTTGSLFVSGSTVQIGNNTLIGRTELSGSITISGSTEFGGDLVPLYARGATIGTFERPFRDIFLQSASINMASDIIGGRNATISNADGNITIQAAGFQLKSGSVIPFEITDNARVQIATPNVPGNDPGSLLIVATTSGSYYPVINAGGLLHLVGPDGFNGAGAAARLSIDSYGNAVNSSPFITTKRARGTADTPQPLLIGDKIFRLSSTGYATTNYNNNIGNSFSGIEITATENFNSSSFGSDVSIYTIPNGTTSRVLSANFNGNGLILPIVPTNNTATQVLVWDSLSGRVGKQSGANNLDGGAAASVYLSVTEELNGGGA